MWWRVALSLPLDISAVETRRTPDMRLFPALIVVALGVSAHAAEPDGSQFFREKIEPVLISECYSCHSAGAKKVQSGLRLDSRGSALRGGDTGPAVVPNAVKESLLIQALRHEEGLEMPPKGPKLPESVIDDFVRWVDMGAPFGSDETAKPAETENPRKHWAFQPVKPVTPPSVRDAGWVKTPIDAFILAALESKGWTPAPPASRADWLRRVTFDLTGLPPAPGEIDTFERDTSPDAFDRVADRLLDSPRYGERWAQHWLDVVRYAETEGYEYDRTVPDAWRFRDYVIQSLNRDKPFDTFVIEQIAGDEVAPKNTESLSASIFHRLGPVRRNAGDAEIALSRNEVLTERTDILGTAFLGLSVGCARCHNHKLEPISQKDYYRLQAFVAATDEHNVSLASAEETAAWKKKDREIKEKAEALKAKARMLSGAEREKLGEQIEALEDTAPPPLATIPAIENNWPQRTKIHVLKRGVWENKGELVGPRPPSILVSDSEPELPGDVADPRTKLARWLVSPANPLTARVLVNRVWQNHFGAGIVKTVNDFGTKGAKPSHPELLDWLAGKLVADGWRLKPLHKAIVLSATYRQANTSPIEAQASVSDPENRLLWKFNRRRLSAEEIRDAMLAVSGRLNLKEGGPSIMLPIDAELVKMLYKPSQWSVARDPADHDRRSIYLIAKRNLRLPFLETFDAPAALASCGRRETSTHAPQALELLNGTLSNDLAESFAKRLNNEGKADPEQIVMNGFREALGRVPTPEEKTLALAFLREQPLREFALALFNLNGFLYVP